MREPIKITEREFREKDVSLKSYDEDKTLRQYISMEDTHEKEIVVDDNKLFIKLNGELKQITVEE